MGSFFGARFLPLSFGSFTACQALLSHVELIKGQLQELPFPVLKLCSFQRLDTASSTQRRKNCSLISRIPSAMADHKHSHHSHPNLDPLPLEKHYCKTVIYRKRIKKTMPATSGRCLHPTIRFRKLIGKQQVVQDISLRFHQTAGWREQFSVSSFWSTPFDASRYPTLTNYDHQDRYMTVTRRYDIADRNTNQEQHTTQLYNGIHR